MSSVELITSGTVSLAAIEIWYSLAELRINWKKKNKTQQSLTFIWPNSFSLFVLGTPTKSTCRNFKSETNSSTLLFFYYET